MEVRAAEQTDMFAQGGIHIYVDTGSEFVGSDPHCESSPQRKLAVSISEGLVVVPKWMGKSKKTFAF
jgi:hypothetical protein